MVLFHWMIFLIGLVCSQKLDNMGISSLLDETVDLPLLNETPSNECIICFERKQDVTLPCAHSFCTKCIEEWYYGFNGFKSSICEKCYFFRNETHDTCPICREKLASPSDAWVISEVPKAEEISNEITENLLELTEQRPSTCNPS